MKGTKSQQSLAVTSAAFEHGGMIPAKYTGASENASPPITWGGAPAGTRSFMLVAYDPDAPAPFLPLLRWVHWVVYNIPPDVTALPEALPRTETLEGGARQGVTSFRRAGYGGPSPLIGTHRYFFKVFALDSLFDLPPKQATWKRLLNATEGHVLAEGELMGRYRRG